MNKTTYINMIRVIKLKKFKNIYAKKKKKSIK
jgi:hypothetical protein